MVFVQLQLTSHALCHILTVTCQHHGFLHTQCLHGSNSRFTILFHHIVDEDVSRIFSINSHMDNGARIAITGMPLGSHSIHHLRIAHTDHLLTHLGSNALARQLFHITHLATIGSLIGEGVAQGSTNGMSREVLHMSSHVQDMGGIRMYSLHGKTSMRQGACLVEHHSIHLCQEVQIVGALHQNTLPRGTANTAKEGQGHTDD